MDTIYYSKTVSKRHETQGYFEKEDFGEIKIISLTDQEAPLYILLTEDKKKRQIRKFKGIYLTDDIHFPFSRGAGSEYLKKQGYFSPKLIKSLGIELRKSNTSYYPAPSYNYYLIGKRLYSKLCKISQLSITTSSNTLFGNWYSLKIESYYGKGNIKFTPKRWENHLIKIKKHIKKLNKGRKEKVYFSYPRVIV